MDILSLLKVDQENLLTGIQNLLTQGGMSCWKKLLDEIGLAIELQENFLLPEISDVLPNSKQLLIEADKLHKKLNYECNYLISYIKCDEALSKDEAPKESLLSLLKLIEQFAMIQREKMMPQVREYFSGQEREDLGQIYLDFKSDFCAVS